MRAEREVGRAGMCREKKKVPAHGEGFREVRMQPPKGGTFGLVSLGFAAPLNMHRGFLGCKRSL